ncbi:MAG: response regulator [Bacteroidota bacterium]|nr:response regulator [Bacteroidota bacterium]
MKKKIQLLLIEDSPADTELLIYEVEKGGFKPAWKRICTARELHKILPTEDWDLILCDFMMPGFSGLEAIKIIKKAMPLIPVILVSGFVGEEKAVEAMLSGASDYILKDNLTRLIPAMQRELHENESRKAYTETQIALEKQTFLSQVFLDHMPDITLLIRKENYEIVAANQHAIKIGAWPGTKCYESLYKNSAICDNCPIPKTNNDQKDQHIVMEEDGKVLDKHFINVDNEHVLYYAFDITSVRENEKKLKNSFNRLQNLARHLETVREKERKQIAQDLHDDLGQILTAIKMDLSWLEKKLLESKSDFVKKTGSIKDVVTQSIKAVQRISANLRPSILDDLGLMEALNWQLNQFHERTGILLKLDLPDEEPELLPEQAISVYRIVQEALTNIARHANASKVQLSISVDKNDLNILIKDNGIGISENHVKSSKSLGIMNMRERVYQWDGKMSIKGEDKKGTSVRISFKLPDKK